MQAQKVAEKIGGEEDGVGKERRGIRLVIVGSNDLL